MEAQSTAGLRLVITVLVLFLSWGRFPCRAAVCDDWEKRGYGNGAWTMKTAGLRVSPLFTVDKARLSPTLTC